MFITQECKYICILDIYISQYMLQTNQTRIWKKVVILDNSDKETICAVYIIHSATQINGRQYARNANIENITLQILLWDFYLSRQSKYFKNRKLNKK